MKQVHTIPEPLCQICGVPISIAGHCFHCKEHVPPYKKMRSWLVYEGSIRQALLELKYRRNLGLGDALAKEFARFVKSLNWEVDLVVPVPLGKLRMKERGYNQTGLVARPLAEIMHWHYAPEAVVRSRETKSQVGLTIAERKENVSGAFLGNNHLVSGATIMLLDDVATTGATLSACADTLLETGASDVFALTLARALPHHDLFTV